MTDFVKKTDVIGGDRAQFDIDNDYRRYLAETDWYVIREQETGESIPTDVKANRSHARLAIQSPFITGV